MKSFKIEMLLYKNIFKKKILVNSHKNFYKTYFLRNNKSFLKTSNTIKGVRKIILEKKGYHWYLNKQKKKVKNFIKSINIKKKQAHIELKRIEGYQLKSWAPLKLNYKKLKSFFYYYKKYLYSSNKNCCVHGDLTLDNIIFNKSNTFIIDWEFFNKKKNFRGYDLAYLYLSALCLPYLHLKKASKYDESHFLKLWKLLSTLKVNKKILRDPFNFFESYIKKDKVFKDSLGISKSKFFPLITNKKYKNRVKRLICEKI